MPLFTGRDSAVNRLLVFEVGGGEGKGSGVLVCVDDLEVGLDKWDNGEFSLFCLLICRNVFSCAKGSVTEEGSPSRYFVNPSPTLFRKGHILQTVRMF